MVDPDAGPIAAYLHDQVVAAFDAAADLPDEVAVHHTRVAMRRLRSALRVFGPLLSLAPDEVARADAELRWFAGLLGDVRDRQVQRARFAAALEALPPELVLGPVAARIEDTLHAEQLAAADDLARATASDRGRALRHLLGTWRHHPPVGDGVRKAAVVKRALKAAKKAERRLKAACRTGADTDLHRARKAAKRARYAAEVLRPLGRGAKQRKRYKLVQRLLGRHQDAVVAEATLLRLVTDTPAGEGFTFGLLHAHEREAADRLRAEVCRLVPRR